MLFSYHILKLQCRKPFLMFQNNPEGLKHCRDDQVFSVYYSVPIVPLLPLYSLILFKTRVIHRNVTIIVKISFSLNLYKQLSPPIVQNLVSCLGYIDIMYHYSNTPVKFRPLRVQLRFTWVYAVHYFSRFCYMWLHVKTALITRLSRVTRI